MRIGKLSAGLFLVAVFLVSRCFALVFSVIQHTNDVNGTHKPSVELWADNHSAGSKEENIAQLTKFAESLPLLGRVHLVIESKFFYQFNCLVSRDFDALLDEMGGAFFAQDPNASTWIAWDLPFVLIKIFNDQPLPEYINLTPDQKNLIKQNITVDFLDPRLQLEKPDVAPKVALNLEQHVEEKFVTANNRSPKKTREALYSYVTSRVSDKSEESRGPSSYDHLFDIEALSSIVASLYDDDRSAPKIIVLCGAWHAYHLDLIMPSLELNKRKEYKLMAPVQNPVARKLIF